MNTDSLQQTGAVEWRMEPRGAMRVPGILYADEALLREMDEKVLEQLANVAALPGIVHAAFAMPDAHWGYGFPIGGVAAFDAEAGGVISAGGVGFDISCGVRTLLTPFTRAEIEPRREELANRLLADIPAGVGSTGGVRLPPPEMDALLAGGARWAVERGFGRPEDLARIENDGCAPGADPRQVSPAAKRRQQDETGTLGSGNHYLEVQEVAELYDAATAAAFGLRAGGVVVSIHCGSRGLGHQVATDYSRRMAAAADRRGLRLADRELACAPLRSDDGQAYLGAMRAAINCALANRQVLGHLVRRAFRKLWRRDDLPLLYDVSHNTCRAEEHPVDGRAQTLFVHRKGATAAAGPGDPTLPAALRPWGQPVLVGGTMGTASYILAGTAAGAARAFGSACHGAGRAMSRHQALQQWQGREVVAQLAGRGILLRTRSLRGVAEEAPGAYKDVCAVVEVTERAQLARKVARLHPLICVKG